MSVYRLDQSPWSVRVEDFPSVGVESDKLTFMLRYAILAPSSHNTQPWKFRVTNNFIEVYTDDSRWLKVSDPEKREMNISVGCAVENLVLAADRFGYHCAVSYISDSTQPDLAVRVDFSLEPEHRITEVYPLFDAIINRDANHRVYDGRPIPPDEQQQLQMCEEEGVVLHLTDDPEIKRKVDEIVVKGDAILFSNPAYREELGYWFGQGVFGTPWLLSRISQMAITYLDVGKSQAKKDSEVLMSSSLLGIISTHENDRVSWIKTGRVFERVWLQATALGISMQPMSQPIEVEELREETAKLLPKSSLIPQQTFRMGYAEPEKEHTPRRHLSEVLISS